MKTAGLKTDDMRDFCWRIAICDDDGEDSDTIRLTKLELEQLGMEVIVVEDVPGFVDNASKLAGCHLAIIDMDWGNITEKRPISSLPKYEITKEKGVANFIRDWFYSLESWAHIKPVDIPKELKDGDWPQTKIGSKDMGAWIGALFSHIAPGIEVIFCSGSKEVTWGGWEAALGQFRNAQHSVERKRHGEAIPIETLLRHLRRVRTQVLRRIDIYDWMVADVYLPSLFGVVPSERCTVWEPTIDFVKAVPKVTVRMIPENFFPELRRCSSYHSVLREHLKKPDGVAQGYDVLEGLEHDLRDLIGLMELSVERDEVIVQMKRVSQAIFIALPAAFDVARGIWNAIDVLRNKRGEEAQSECKKCLIGAWELFWAWLFEPSCEFSRLAHEYRGQYVCDEALPLEFPPYNLGKVERAERKKEASKRKKPIIDILALRRACAHLDVNEGQDNRGALQICETENQVVICWQGVWNGDQPSIAAFKKTMQKSLEQALGPHRGLPYVVLFGLSHGAEQMSVSIGDRILTILPELSEAPAGSSRRPDNFEFQWIFRKQMPYTEHDL